MIRLEGAEVLCNSLRTNRVLTNLDLSYNALGNAAGILGAALIENDVRTIDCSVVRNFARVYDLVFHTCVFESHLHAHALQLDVTFLC